MSEQMIPCNNPRLCGVQSHRPGTYAKCQAGGSGKVGTYYGEAKRAAMGRTPRLATPDSSTPSAPLSDYVHVPPEDQPTEYGDDYYVPVTDVAIESNGGTIEITPEGRNSFSFDGYNEDEGETVRVNIHSKRDQCYVSVKNPDGSEWDSDADTVEDLDDARRWMREVISQYI